MRPRFWYNTPFLLVDIRDAATLETLRNTVRDEIQATGKRLTELAGEMGVSRAALADFMAYSMPQDSTLERIGLWIDNSGRERRKPRAGQVAITLVAEMYPLRSRARVRRLLARALAAQFRRDGRKVPPWLAEALEG